MWHFGNLFLFEEFIRIDIGLFEYGAQRALGHVAGMIGDCGVAVGCGVKPDLVRAARLPVELHAKSLEPLDDLAISEAGEFAHVGVVPQAARVTR